MNYLLMSLFSLYAFFLRYKVYKELSQVTKKPDPKISSPGITIIKPLKGVDAYTFENLESFFKQDFHAFEILGTFEFSNDSSIDVFSSLQKKYPDVSSRIFIKNPNGTLLNPKISSITEAYNCARYDDILLTDSNTAISAAFLTELQNKKNEDTGLITSIPLGTKIDSFWAMIEAVLLATFYERGMLLTSAFKKTAASGKLLFFDKRRLNELGGLSTIEKYHADDVALGNLFIRNKKKVTLYYPFIKQTIGNLGFKLLCLRHQRWTINRKLLIPKMYACEPLSYSLVPSLTLAILLQGHDPYRMSFFIGSLFFLFDCYVFHKSSSELMTFPRILFLPVAWIFSEIFMLILWVSALFTNKISWHGRAYLLEKGGVIKAV